jgi:hypothetical protein
MGDARRAMELSRERMYAERSKRNRTIMLYTTGSVSLCLTNLESVSADECDPIMQGSVMSIRWRTMLHTRDNQLEDTRSR